ncbi:MAG: hypothetical protein IJP35_03200 [Clostridia bacterium]|nr:hypothetical protein [Clostridia bacterium]
MKRKVFTILTCLLTALALGVRLWQVGFVIDDFGFYAASLNTLCTVIDLILLAAVVILGLLARFTLEKSPKAPKKQSLWLGIGSLTLAFFCLPQCYLDAVTAADQKAMVLAVAPSVLTAVCFVMLAACQMRGQRPSYPVVLLPVIGELLRVVVVYTHFNGLSRVTENVVYILFLLSFLLFTMAHFRVYFAADRRKGMAGCYAYGLATAVFGLASTLPHWLMGNHQLPMSYFGFGAAVYALIFMAVNARPQTQEALPAPSEELPTEAEEPPVASEEERSEKEEAAQ